MSNDYLDGGCKKRIFDKFVELDITMEGVFCCGEL